MKVSAKILVVDDNPAALEATVRILKQAGYEGADGYIVQPVANKELLP